MAANQVAQRLRSLFLYFNCRRTAARPNRRRLSLESLETRELMAADLLGAYFNSDEPIRWGDSFNVDAIVHNGGNSTAPGSTVKFYLSTNSTITSSDIELGSRSVPVIGANRDYRFDNHRLKLPSNPPSGFTATDNVYIGMIVDATGRVGEGSSGERNNANRGTGRDRDAVRINPGPSTTGGTPDLTGTYFNSDEPLRWGDSFNVDAIVHNGGNSTAPGSTVKFYLSTNSTITSSDFVLGSRTIPAIGANRDYRFDNHRLQLPSNPPSGFTATDNVYIGMIVDATGQVDEGSSGEGNNANRGTGRDRDAVRINPPAAPAQFPATAITSSTAPSVFATTLNAFSPQNSPGQDLRGQCTWYVYGRVIELVNQGYLSPKVRTMMEQAFWGRTGRDARNWPSILGGTWVSTANAPLPMELRQPGQIAVWTAGSHGHVGFVEEVSADKTQYRLTDFNRSNDGTYRSQWYSYEGTSDRLLGTYPKFLQLQRS